jgi:hypothetical protein
MMSSVTAARRVAAANMPATHVHPQLDPRPAKLAEFFTNQSRVFVRIEDYYLVKVRTSSYQLVCRAIMHFHHGPAIHSSKRVANHLRKAALTRDRDVPPRLTKWQKETARLCPAAASVRKQSVSE